jgi:hypothetical protein
MKSCISCWSYLAHLLLEWEMLHTKVIEKLKPHVSYSVSFFLRSYLLWDKVEKYGRAGQTTDDNIIRRMRFYAAYLRLQTHTQNMHYYFLFHGNSRYASAPRYYVVSNWSVLLCVKTATLLVCVCVWEIERENVCVSVWEIERECVCECVRDRDRMCVWDRERMCVWVCEIERGNVCVGVWEIERENMCVSVWER